LIAKHGMDRRDFLKSAALASAAVALGGGERVMGAGKRPLLVKISGAGVPRDLPAAIAKLLAPLGGMQAFIKKGQRVLLKPNMGFPTPPRQRATTSPALVAAVAKLALDCGAGRVMVIDNPTRRPEACMRTIGIKEALADLDVHLLLPTDDKFYKQTPIPRGKSLKRTKIVKEALECDVHIALPIAKSHNAAGFSGTLKGMMGLILDRESFHSRYDLNQAVADLNTVIKPELVIMDGLEVMTTDGPAGPGDLVTRNTLLAGTDPLAVDAAGVRLAPLYGRKIKPRQVKHLKIAQAMGLGTLEPPVELVVEIKI